MNIKKLSTLALSSLSLLLLGAMTISCRNNRPVVPYESDTEDVYKPLLPNEEEYPDGYTYGPDSIPGFNLKYEIPGDSADIYIYVEEFTSLDANPAINLHLLSFIESQLDMYGFMPSPQTEIAGAFIKYIESGMSQKEGVEKVLDDFREDFYRQLPEINTYGPAFNISFIIYPVFIDSDYVTYRQSAYCYTGGAHGTNTSYLATYKLSDGSLLTLDDIVRKEALPQVREEVAAHMAFSYPIYENITTVDQYIDSLNAWLGNPPASSDEKSGPRITLENYPLPDPALTESGLVFIYPMYELTPGSDGCPVVVVPYQELKGCLITKI